MNKRLEEIYALIGEGRGLVDVGTDHGYIPAALAKSGYSGKIIASDINPGPLQAARRSAESAGVADKIDFLLCDGLDGCDPSAIDTIVIAGMGGVPIRVSMPPMLLAKARGMRMRRELMPELDAMLTMMGSMRATVPVLLTKPPNRQHQQP